MYGYFFLPLGNKSETATPKAWDRRSASWSETQRTPASILARVPLEMSRPARWHLAESCSWEMLSPFLSLLTCFPMMFEGKSCSIYGA